MKQYACYNGEFINEADVKISLTNRNFLYGDGLFETVRSVNGNPFFIDGHVARIQSCMDALQLKGGDIFTSKFLTESISRLNNLNGITAGGRARIIIYRNEGGTYLPDKNSCSFIIRADALPVNTYELNENGISVCIYSEIKKTVNKLASFKTCNSLLYVLASVYAQQNNFSDALIINEEGNVCEGTSSNIFWVTNKKIFTPPLSEGCVGGVLRHVLLNQFRSLFFIEEKKCTTKDLVTADEIFLTNSIGGFRWVNLFLDKKYGNEITHPLVTAFVKQMFNG